MWRKDFGAITARSVVEFALEVFYALGICIGRIAVNQKILHVRQTFISVVKESFLVHSQQTGLRCVTERAGDLGTGIRTREKGQKK